jgi:hypothetical protein
VLMMILLVRRIAGTGLPEPTGCWLE